MKKLFDLRKEQITRKNLLIIVDVTTTIYLWRFVLNFYIIYNFYKTICTPTQTHTPTQPHTHTQTLPRIHTTNASAIILVASCKYTV